MGGDNQEYEDLNEEIRSKLTEELTDDLIRMHKAKENLTSLMENMEGRKIVNKDSHNFVVETIRTQLEVALDNLENAIYQSNEILMQISDEK